MKPAQRSARDVQPRQGEKRGERGEHQQGAGGVDPLAHAEPENGHHDERRHQRHAHQQHEPVAAGEPLAARPEDVDDVLRDLQSRVGGIEDGEQPQVPRDEEPGQLVEPELRPLVQAALERHQAIQVDDDDRRRDVEEHDRREPEDDVRRTELRRDTHPREPDDEEDLREGEIGQPELTFEFDGRIAHRRDCLPTASTR